MKNSQAKDHDREIKSLIEKKLNTMIFVNTTDDQFAVGFRAGLLFVSKTIDQLAKENQPQEKK